MFSIDTPYEIAEWVFLFSTIFIVTTFVFKPFASPQMLFKSVREKKLFRLYFYSVVACSLLALLPFLYILYILINYKRWEDGFWADAPMLLANICIFYITAIDWQALKHSPTHDGTSHSSISYTPGTPVLPL